MAEIDNATDDALVTTVVGEKRKNVEENVQEVDATSVQQPTVATNPKPTNPKPNVSLVKRLTSFAKRNVWTGSACLASAGLGVLFAYVPSLLKAPEEVAIVEPEPIYVATTVHRSEPISPIIPFAELDEEVVELGMRLFHDSKLSGNGKVSCVSCHNEKHAGSDGRRTAIGLDGEPFKLNTPTIFNAALNYTQNWAGSATSLEEQLNTHFTPDGAMGADWERVLKAITLDPYYNRSFQIHLGGEPTEALIRQAIATYERSLLTMDSEFDQWLQGKSELSGDETAGYDLFKKHNCISCHQGAGVGGTMHQPLDGMSEYFGSGDTLQDQPSHLRVPALRNVALTAPYFHDGSAESLEDAVEAMMRYQIGLEPNAIEVQRISAFLRTLTGKLPPLKPEF